MAYPRLEDTDAEETREWLASLEYILETLKANPAAIDDVAAFQATMDTFVFPSVSDQLSAIMLAM